jgi:hypothetical protein
MIHHEGTKDTKQELWGCAVHPQQSFVPFVLFVSSW